MDVEIDIQPKEVVRTVTLAVTLLAVGGLLGVEYTARAVLAHQGPLATAPWVDGVETVRFVLLGVAVWGFGAMLVLDHYTA